MPKTSVWLPDDVKAAARDSGVPLGELVRRGLAAGDPDEALARAAALQAVTAVLGDLAAIVRTEVRSALRDAQGGF
jgi:hypothetical protein